MFIRLSILAALIGFLPIQKAFASSSLYNGTYYSNQEATQVLEVLKKYGVQQAGNLQLGSSIQGSPYFHFYVDRKGWQTLYHELMKNGDLALEKSFSDKESSPEKLRVILRMTHIKEKKDILSLHQSLENPSQELKELQKNFPQGKLTGSNSFIVKGDEKTFQKIFETLPTEGPFVLEKNPYWDQGRLELAFSKRKSASIVPIEAERSQADYVFLWTAEVEDSKVLESKWRQQFQFEITNKGYLFHVDSGAFRNWTQDLLKSGSLTVYKTQRVRQGPEKLSVLLISEDMFDESAGGSTPKEGPQKAVYIYSDVNAWLGVYFTKSARSTKKDVKTFKNLEGLRGWNSVQADLRYFNIDSSSTLAETSLFDAGIGYKFFNEHNEDRLGFVTSARVKSVAQGELSVVLLGLGLRYEDTFPAAISALFENIPVLSNEKHFLINGDFFSATMDSQVKIQNSYFLQFLTKIYFTPHLYGQLNVFTTSENISDQSSNLKFQYNMTNFGLGAGYSF